VAIGLLGIHRYYFASFVDFLGRNNVSAGLGRLILFLYPTLVVALSIGFLHKRPSIREIVGAGPHYSGIALVMSTLLGGGNGICRLGAALCFATHRLTPSTSWPAARWCNRVGSIRFTRLCHDGREIFLHRSLVAQAALGARLPPPGNGRSDRHGDFFSTVLPVFITSGRCAASAQTRWLWSGRSSGDHHFFRLGRTGRTMTPVQLAGAALVARWRDLVTLRPANNFFGDRSWI